MLKLNGIRKNYKAGGAEIAALKGVSIEFRECEFVAVLGHSGCGKTTLLNIIGGLDHADEGVLTINGVSTADFSDRDWDTYRNHSVGFVFQSYNLIPHQTVLENVELALTLSGVGREERRRRAAEALDRVGLGDQAKKKPSQLSGGQMQRVAIARAIVNDPEILLADEPTGALDSETSVQVMDILKQISKDRLVIMVTHNPDLADKYATRIVRLSDGEIISDSRPCEGDRGGDAVKSKKNRSMSFFTALGLSMKNLLTKKGRTVMTGFAGSIGIIGIALILSVSQGVDRFIDKIQEDTLTKYPLTINAETVDMTALLSSFQEQREENSAEQREDGYVYNRSGIASLFKALTSVSSSKNNVNAFKKHIESNEEFQKAASAVTYEYPIVMNLYYKTPSGEIVRSDSESVIRSMYEAMGVSVGGAYSTMLTSMSSSLTVWERMLPGKDGELVSDLITGQYDLVAGEWPKSKNDVVLILNERNELSDFVLYSLGLKSSEEFNEIVQAAMKGEEIEVGITRFSYEELLSRSFRLILSPDFYRENSDGTYTDLSASQSGLALLWSDPDKYTEIRISGIIKPNDNSLYSMLNGSIGFTNELAEYVITATEEHGLVKAQLSDPLTDALTGLSFPSDGSTGKGRIDEARRRMAGMTDSEKAAIYVKIASEPDGDYLEKAVDQAIKAMGRDAIISRITTKYAGMMGGSDPETITAYFDRMSDDDIAALIKDDVTASVRQAYAYEVKESLSGKSEAELASMLDPDKISDDVISALYDEYFAGELSGSTYEKNLSILGYVDRNEPSAITIYASSFADKNRISELVDEYNASVDEENVIHMTDYVKLLMSSVSTVIDAISYVLIAFVGISLVVSSIMIGVITNISVLERTKEIGILRAIGASKGDIARVFNAETLVIGLFAGLLGIAVTLILIIPINALLHYFTGIPYLSAQLPVGAAAILVLLSVLLTVTAGLIPSRAASKKDPVEALRTE
ncbi:MAG: ABC transporter ATP-binding protein/permease [Clostridia bacterium]|nr:ABC transporter ATP-binding protein/permease [Clostridia bacterium]